MRKIIQIAALRHGELSDRDGKQVMSADTELVALCDDGSVWTLFDTLKSEWVRAPDIPQDPLTDAEERLLRTWTPNQLQGELSRAVGMSMEEYKETLQGVLQKLGAKDVVECIKLARKSKLLA